MSDIASDGDLWKISSRIKTDQNTLQRVMRLIVLFRSSSFCGGHLNPIVVGWKIQTRTAQSHDDFSAVLEINTDFHRPNN